MNFSYENFFSSFLDDDAQKIYCVEVLPIDVLFILIKHLTKIFSIFFALPQQDLT